MLKRLWMVLFLLCFSVTSHATMLTFDSFTVPAGGTTPYGSVLVEQGFSLSAPYAAAIMDMSYLAPGAHSGNNVLQPYPFSYITISSLDGSPFSVQNGYMMSRGNSGFQMGIRGYRNGESVDYTSFYVDQSWLWNWQQVTINFENIDRLVFDVSGYWMLLDDLLVNAEAAPVPEPGTITYLVAGAGLLYLYRRTRMSSVCQGVPSKTASVV